MNQQELGSPPGFRSAADLGNEFPILQRGAYLNHSAVAPLPARTARALRQWSDQAQVSVAQSWPRWAAALGRARSNAANLLNTSTDQIAFVHNTTHGLLCVANSLPWRPGDNVLVAEHEFPANVHPWRNLAARGVACRTVPERDGGRFLIEDFIQRIDARTRLVAVSLVQYSTGFRMPVEDLAQVCRERGILLCLDAIQGLGAMPIDVTVLGCDFLTADGHKWLLAPEGFGILFIRKPLLDQMNDSMTGWAGRVTPADYGHYDQPLAQAAKRFEEGSHCMSMAVAFEQSTALLLEVGLERIWNSIESLTDRLAHGIRELGFELISPRREGEKSGIVAFKLDGIDNKAWLRSLEEENIFIASRRGWLRVSPHFYNRPDQIDALLDALKELRNGG